MEYIEMKIIQMSLSSRLNLNDRTPDSEDIIRIHNICGIGVKYLMISGVSSLKYIYKENLKYSRLETLN